METISYKVGSTWTEVGFADLGVGATAHMNLGTHGESKFILPLASLPPETAVAILFESPCIIYTSRTGSGSSWSGGSILFQGRRIDNRGQASATGASQELVIEDAWYDLRFLTYQCAWQNVTGYSGSTPTYGTPYVWPDCVLFQSNLGGQLLPNGTFGTYSPTPVNGHITTGQMLEEILAYAIYFGGVNLQIGTLSDCATYVPFYPIRAMRCADAIILALRVHPDCTCEIDYTTTPPTFNVRKQASLTTITLPYKGSGSNRTHLTSSVRPRPELIPSRIGIYIKSTATISNQPVVSIATDIYPSSSSGLRSLDVSVDMTGPKLAKTTAVLTTSSFDPTSLAWWAAKVPAFKNIANGGQIPNTGTGSLALLDTTINGGSGHLKGLQVVDDSNSPINISAGNYAYELLTGTPCAWMQATVGGNVNVIEANIVGFFSYYKETTAGASNLVDQIGEHMHTCKVKLTNTASGTYQLSTTLSTGEVYPTGLAQAIYTALQTLQYNFTHTILEAPYATMIKPGKHALNLSGGASAWSTMAAMIQAVDYEFMLAPGAPMTVSKTTVHCGPVAHLETRELIELLNIFCNRDLSKINPNERANGSDLSGGQVTLGSDSPKENSVPAISVPAVVNVTAPDVTASNVTNIFTQDATQHQISVLQNSTSVGTTIITGLIAPEFNGTGSPSGSSLPANAYFRVGDHYIDTSANALWRCTASGTNSSSSWAQISGGGGSVQKFTFVSDKGDFFLATPAISASVSTTLATAFGNAAAVTTLSVTSAAGIAAGQSITGTGIPSSVIVVSVSGTTITTSGFTSTSASSGSYTFGAAVAIAKPPKIRCSITGDTQIDGSGAHTYTYTAVTVGGVIVAYTRTNSWTGPNSQVESITPAYLVGDTIYAIGMPSANMPIIVGSGTNVAVALMDIHDKDWAI